MVSDLDSCLIIDDADLLNFSLEDVDKPPCSFSNPNSQDYDVYSPSLPAFAEEELEWISNKDSFPALDDILSNPTQTVTSNPSHSVTSCCSSLHVPLNYPVRKRSSRRPKSRQCWRWNQVTNPQPPAVGAVLGRKCQHCLAEKTPQWRAGPTGPKTLCNACGVRYKSGRLVEEYRPANSPTFSIVLHSNSHKKIMEMRKKMEGG